MGLGTGEPQIGGWETGSHRPTLPPPPPQVPGPGNHGKGNLAFSCFALNPFLSPSSGPLLGSPHPAPPPPPQRLPFWGEAGGCTDPRAPPPPSWLRGPSPSPPHGALGHTSGPSHAHPHAQASPSTRGVDGPRLHLGASGSDSLSTPTAGFCQALACPTGGPGQRCGARVAGLQPYLRLRDERPPRRRRARRRRRKEPAEPETVRGGCSCQDNE